MTKASEKQIGILYLPENVIRGIFQYLSYAELYLSIRKTCRLFSKHVENYIQIGGVFLLVTGVMNHDKLQVRRPPCKIVYVLKQNQKLLTIFYKDIPPLPMPNRKRIVNDLELMSCEEIACFGGLIKKRVIAGYFCKEHWTGPISGGLRKNISKVSSVFKRYRNYPTYQSTYRLVPYVYEYQGSRKMWVLLTAVDTSLKHLEFHSDIACHLSHCPTEDSIIFRLDMYCSTYIDIYSNTYINHSRNDMILLKFNFLPENEDGTEIQNDTTLPYAMKVLSIYNKSFNPHQRRRNLPSFPAISENSGRVIFVQDGYTKRKNDGDLEGLNLDYELTSFKGWYGSNDQYKGFILDNKMYIVENTCFNDSLDRLRDENQLLFARYDLNNEKPSRFPHFVPYSTLKIQEAVTDSEGSFSLMLAHIPTIKKFHMPTSSVHMPTSPNYITITGIELILFCFTESVDVHHDPMLQGGLKHEVFHPEVYFDDADNVSKSTILRIS